MSDEPVPVISDEEKQQFQDIFDDETLTDDEKEEQISKLPENIQNWAVQMIYYAFLDNTSQLAAEQRRNDFKGVSETL